MYRVVSKMPPAGPLNHKRLYTLGQQTHKKHSPPPSIHIDRLPGPVDDSIPHSSHTPTSYFPTNGHMHKHWLFCRQILSCLMGIFLKYLYKLLNTSNHRNIISQIISETPSLSGHCFIISCFVHWINNLSTRTSLHLCPISPNAAPEHQSCSTQADRCLLYVSELLTSRGPGVVLLDPTGTGHEIRSYSAWCACWLNGQVFVTVCMCWGWMGWRQVGSCLPLLSP